MRMAQFYARPNLNPLFESNHYVQLHWML
jgi:hypothetical protein